MRNVRQGKLLRVFFGPKLHLPLLETPQTGEKPLTMPFKKGTEKFLVD